MPINWRNIVKKKVEKKPVKAKEEVIGKSSSLVLKIKELRDTMESTGCPDAVKLGVNALIAEVEKGG
jgi:hypothetical protein